MPEFNSRQAAAIAAGSKTLANSLGKKRVAVITSPATAAYAQNDTIASATVLPKGTRFLADSLVSNAALGASVTLSVGIRNAKTKAVIDATAIANAVAVATAGQTLLNNGTKVAAGIEYVTTEEVEVYATLGGGTPTTNAQFRIEVSYTSYD